MKKALLLTVTHVVALVVGFAAGIYLLPILTAVPDASASEVQQVQESAVYEGTFVKDQPGSDALHWANGTIYLAPHALAFEGEIAPGPDYKIYLTREQATDQASFLAMKAQAVLISDLKNFGDFTKPIPAGVDINDYTTVQIWCERFSKFIGSARYR